MREKNRDSGNLEDNQSFNGAQQIKTSRILRETTCKPPKYTTMLEWPSYAYRPIVGLHTLYPRNLAYLIQKDGRKNYIHWISSFIIKKEFRPFCKFHLTINVVGLGPGASVCRAYIIINTEIHRYRSSHNTPKSGCNCRNAIVAFPPPPSHSRSLPSELLVGYGAWGLRPIGLTRYTQGFRLPRF